MEKSFFEDLCKKLSLGSIIQPPCRVNGGLTNKIYKLITTNNTYAVKILNEEKITKDSNLVDKIEKSEEISNIAYNNGVKSITAIKLNNRYIQKINDKYILLYYWNNGKILLTKEINLKHIKKLAKQMAILHRISVKKDDYIKNVHKKIELNHYLKTIQNINDNWAEDLKNNIENINKIYEKVYYCYTSLSNQLSYVHKDLNRRNIMWENDELSIIDWETATIGNPSLDFFNSAWFLTADVQEDKYYTFAKEYLKNMELYDDINISIYAALIDEFEWLEFSLKRALGMQGKDTDEIQLGIDSIGISIKEITNYYEKIPEMLRILNLLK